ncbi:MAG: hypothetical protein U0234_08835 [Sandaracinus sp.]
MRLVPPSLAPSSSLRSRGLALSLAASVGMLAGCPSSPGAPLPFTATTFEVVVAADAPMGVSHAAEDVVTQLARMGVDATLVPGSASTARGCEMGLGRIVLLGDALGDSLTGWERDALPTDQTFAMHETRCSGGTLVELAGGGLLGRQYAAYELLHALGVRFFHPEETYAPASLHWPEAPLDRVHTPSFRWRSVSLHLTHPLELGDAFLTGTADAQEAVRYIDWTLANGASRGQAGVGSGALARYGLERGFPREAGLNLHEVQQGGRPVVDPDDPRPASVQIAEAVDAVMGNDPASYPTFFQFLFNPSEFTELPDEQIVDELTTTTDYLTTHYPGTRVMTINHGTHGPPTAHYHVRYYDLPQFAPPELGVSVHPLMFYDLERPAPVYGNEDFHFLDAFIQQEAPRRRIVYFPEAAYWLTFDIALPVYLPITIEARDRDIQHLRPLLATDPSSDHGVDGHHTFGTGHEWGYWQNEYCSLRMSMDVDYRYTDCLADIVSPLGPTAGSETLAVLEALIDHQARDWMTSWQDTLPYLVGTDPETEVAASLGIAVHPLPPTPTEMMAWDLPTVRAWRAQHVTALQRTDDELRDLVRRLRAVQDDVEAGGEGIFAEILDGVEITGLRARHAWQAYGAVAMAREAALTADAALEDEARMLLADAADTTHAASAVVARREAHYRYAPIERSIAGGESFADDTNWSVYHYRYLARTHWLYYWTRVDRLAEEAITGGGGAVRVADALLEPGASLVVDVLDAELTGVAIDPGDGSPPGTGSHYEHAYALRGVYPFALTARRGVDPFELAGPVASLLDERATGFTAHVAEPSGASLIEGVLPALVLGTIADGRIAVGFSARATGEVELGRWSEVAPASGTTLALETVPATLEIPVVNRRNGSVSTTLLVEEGIVSQASAGAPIVLSGQLTIDAVIDAVVAIGGFDREGATAIVASTLGYTPATLPGSVAFRVEYDAP